MVTIPSATKDEGVVGHDFILNIRDPVRRRIALPLSFVVVVSELNPSGLWLRAQGYPYCPLWVRTHFEGPASMFLEDGWRTFARLFNLRKGDSLCCKFDGEVTLSVRAFNAGGDRLECCMGSSSEDVPLEEDNTSREVQPTSSSSHGGRGGDSYSSCGSSVDWSSKGQVRRLD